MAPHHIESWSNFKRINGSNSFPIVVQILHHLMDKKIMIAVTSEPNFRVEPKTKKKSQFKLLRHHAT